jgi:hypothetical protein
LLVFRSGSKLSRAEAYQIEQSGGNDRFWLVTLTEDDDF